MNSAEMNKMKAERETGTERQKDQFDHNPKKPITASETERMYTHTINSIQFKATTWSVSLQL